MNIQTFVNTFSTQWNNASPIFPQLGTKISLEEKQKRELVMQAFSEKMNTNVDSKKLSLTGRKKLKTQFQQNLIAFFRNCFNFDMKEIEIISGQGFFGVTGEFMQKARKFDTEIQIEDIFQASRNVWIINSLQIMMGEELKITDAVFAYSMLYPYSDNYLDNPQISIEEKMDFSHKFRLKLAGENPTPANSHEHKIFKLVEMIESDFDRNQFPEVYESLLAIHDAQTKSIFLLRTNKQLSENDLIEICIEKGGTSVLADGYLINGKLTPEQEMFCFGFGVLLQFVDDIQDIQEDLEGQLCTAFTQSAQQNKLDEFTNKTIVFTQNVLSDLSCFSNNLKYMESLMQKSIFFLMNESVGMNSSYYPVEYVSDFENYSPFRYNFVRERRKHMSSNRISLMKKLETFIFAPESLKEMAFN